MLPQERDAAQLWDMLQSSLDVMNILQGVSLDEFISDKLKRLAVERAMEIIGEAAKRVTAEFQAAHPEIPWREIIGQRNVLAHEYGDVVPEQIWKTGTEEVPRLAERLKEILPPTPSEM